MAAKQFNSIEGYSVGNATIVIDANGNINANALTVSANSNVANLSATGNITAVQLISNVVTGTPPFVVSSNTLVANLAATSATTAGTVTTNAQPNITSVGTLTSLDVTGNTTVGNLIGPHANGNSNINIPAANGNVNISAAGNANILVVTGTGAVISTGTFIAGTANVTSGANITPIATEGQYNITALAVNANILAPSGTAYDGQKLMIRIKDNGTTRNLTWTTTTGGYRVIGTTLPASTPASKTTYVGCIYNSTDTFWDVVAVTTQA